MYYDCADVFDETAMKACPTKSEFDILMGEDKQISLYKQNRRR